MFRSVFLIILQQPEILKDSTKAPSGAATGPGISLAEYEGEKVAG